MKSIQISDELYDQVSRLADADHVPVEAVVTALVSQRIADWARLEARATRGSVERFNRVLSKVPAMEPEAADRLESNLHKAIEIAQEG